MYVCMYVCVCIYIYIYICIYIKSLASNDVFSYRLLSNLIKCFVFEILGSVTLRSKITINF
jgi:hypothetical protein